MDAAEAGGRGGSWAHGMPHRCNAEETPQGQDLCRKQRILQHVRDICGI